MPKPPNDFEVYMTLEQQSNPQFVELWLEWVLNQSRNRKKFPESVARRHLRSLASVSIEAAIASLDYAIFKRWEAPFPKPDMHLRWNMKEQRFYDTPMQEAAPQAPRIVSRFKED